jgi:hypothetical protein
MKIKLPVVVAAALATGDLKLRRTRRHASRSAPGVPKTCPTAAIRAPKRSRRRLEVDHRVIAASLVAAMNFGGIDQERSLRFGLGNRPAGNRRRACRT